eukprot:13549599-Alexandrium_andersonii.AAC.1
MSRAACSSKIWHCQIVRQPGPEGVVILSWHIDFSREGPGQSQQGQHRNATRNCSAGFKTSVKGAVPQGSAQAVQRGTVQNIGECLRKLCHIREFRSVRHRARVQFLGAADFQGVAACYRPMFGAPYFRTKRRVGPGPREMGLWIQSMRDQHHRHA